MDIFRRPVIINLFLSALCGVMLAGVCCAALAEVVDRDGDINLDSSVNTVDVLWGLQTLFGLRTLNPTQEAHGDVAPLVSGIPAPDGVFDLGDVLVIQRKALGIINFSYCGDGIVQTVEQCDDGNLIDNDSCSNSCQFTQVIVPQTTIKLYDGTLDKLYPWFSSSGFSDPNGVFIIENNLIHVSGADWGALTSQDRYRDYVMVFEFRWGTQTFAPRAGKAKDAGVLVHSNGNEGEWNGLLMPGIQAQVMDGSLGDFILAEGSSVPVSMTVATNQVTCASNNWNCRGGYRWDEAGTNVTFNQNNDSVHWSDWDPAWTDIAGYRGQTVVESPDGDWNQLVVIASGTTIDIYLNGVKVNSAVNVSPDEGKLQLEVEYAEYYVRRWELYPLGYVANPVITSVSLSPGVMNAAYSGFVKAAGMLAPVSWSKTGGNLPGGLSVNPATGEISGTPTTVGTFNFTIQVTDTAGGTASQDFEIIIGNNNLITAGLVLQLEAAQGIAEVNGVVTAWADQSGNSNDLFASGAPQFATALAPSGQPAISFDGVDDKLQRINTVNTLVGLPLANTDRTMFAVVRYHSANAAGGVAYGAGSQNRAFGPVVRDTTGKLALMGYGYANDLDSTTAGIGAGWLLQSVVLNNATAIMYKDGVNIVQWTHIYDTALDRFVIGAEIADFGYLVMDVAAVLVYDRALNDLERVTVETYLQNKYLTITP